MKLKYKYGMQKREKFRKMFMHISGMSEKRNLL